MLFYSEKDKKFYKTMDELKAAEKDFDKEQATLKRQATERKQRAKAVEQAYQHAQDVRHSAAEMVKQADQEYRELHDAFCKDYGNFHMSSQIGEVASDDLVQTLSNMLSLWFF